MSWYPGHMKKAFDSLLREVKPASIVLMILDARCPRSSLNPQLEKLFAGKKILYILNKTDLADQSISRKWQSFFEEKRRDVFMISTRNRNGRKELISYLDGFRDEFLKNDRRLIKIFRMVVVGIPNTGKSSVINLLSPERTVKTGKKAGLTRGKQWLKIGNGMEILDSPGIMPHRTDLPDSLWILGAVGSIRQEILPLEDIAGSFINYIRNSGIYPEVIFPDTENRDLPALNLIINFAMKRGILMKGKEPDTEKAALQILKIYREGRIGRISLEKPEY